MSTVLEDASTKVHKCGHLLERDLVLICNSSMSLLMASITEAMPALSFCFLVSTSDLSWAHCSLLFGSVGFTCDFFFESAVVMIVM
jgi:hypothetical protein